MIGSAAYRLSDRPYSGVYFYVAAYFLHFAVYLCLKLPILHVFAYLNVHGRLMLALGDIYF